MSIRFQRLSQQLKGVEQPIKAGMSNAVINLQIFLNRYAQEGWKLHSQEYREVKMGGCAGNEGTTLVCTFERKL
jgi:hypothetical protein